MMSTFYHLITPHTSGSYYIIGTDEFSILLIKMIIIDVPTLGCYNSVTKHRGDYKLWLN